MADILEDASRKDGIQINKRYPVKWMNNMDFKGLPVKANPYEETYICEFLDAVLVNGYNDQLIQSIEIVDNKYLKINFIDETTTFQKYSIISISGTLNAELDEEYRVVDFGDGWITVEIDPNIDLTYDDTAIVKYAPLGWEIAFSRGTRRIYRSPNINSPRPYIIVEGNRYRTSTVGEYCFFAMSDKMIDIDTKHPDAFTVPRVTDDKLNLHQAGTGDVRLLVFNSDQYVEYYTYRNSVNRLTRLSIIGDDRTFHICATNICTGTQMNNVEGGMCDTYIGDINNIVDWDKGCTGINSYATLLTNIKSGNTTGENAEVVKKPTFIMSNGGQSVLEFLIDHEGYGTRNSYGRLAGYNLSTGVFSSGGLYSAHNSTPAYILANPSAYGMLNYITQGIYITDSSPIVGNSIRGAMPHMYWIQSQLTGVENKCGIVVDNINGSDDIYYQIYHRGNYTASPSQQYRMFFNLHKWR